MEVQLESTNRRVDVIGEGVDVAIRVRLPPLEDSDLVMRVLGDRAQCLVASPALLGRLGGPAVPADLSRLPSLDLGAPQDDHAWHLLGPDGASASIHHQPRFVTGSMPALRAAAVAGVGVVQLPTMMSGARLPAANWFGCFRSGRRGAKSSTRCSRRGAACCRRFAR